MLDLANDIRSLSDFKRNTADLMDRLRKTGHPLVLTINGKAELVVQDAEAYQALLDRVEAIEGIQRGLADVKAGVQSEFRSAHRVHGPPSRNGRRENERRSIGRSQSSALRFRQIDQDDIRVLTRAVEHDLFTVRCNVKAGRNVEPP
jgi:prevent-host-death family protein